MPTWIMRRGSLSPSSTARRNGVPWKYFEPKYSSHVSGCASKCTRPRRPWRRASARRIPRVTEWSPPTHTGIAPSAVTSLTRASIAARVRSIEMGTVSTSPQSAMRSFSNGCTLSTGFHGRIRDDCSRTARGPKRAPVRYEVPPSYGMPSSATSTPLAEAREGSSMNVPICPNRGETNGLRGTDVLTANLLERRAEPGDRRQQPGNLVGRVEHREGRARGPDDAESTHERHRAVMAGPDGDAFRVEQGRHVVRVQAVDGERDDGAPADTGWRAGDRHARNLRQPFMGLASQGALVLTDAIHPELLQIFDRRREPHGLGNRRGAGLEPPGQIVPLSVVDPDLLDHFTAAAAGLETIEHRPPAVHNSDAGRAEHLVSREHVEIATERGHIEPQMRGRLSPVHARERADGARLADDLRHRGDRAEHVGDVGERDHTDARGQQTIEGSEVERAVGQDRYGLEHGAPVLGDELPGDEI